MLKASKRFGKTQVAAAQKWIDSALAGEDAVALMDQKLTTPQATICDWGVGSDRLCPLWASDVYALGPRRACGDVIPPP